MCTCIDNKRQKKQQNKNIKTPPQCPRATVVNVFVSSFRDESMSKCRGRDSRVEVVGVGAGAGKGRG